MVTNMARGRRTAKVLAAVVFLAVCAFAVYVFSTSRHTVQLTAQDVQNGLATKFPFEKSDLVYRAKFSQPEVNIDGGSNHITLTLLAEASALGSRTVKGKVSVSGRPRYESATGDLYVDQPRALVSELEYEGLPEKYRGATSAVLAKGLEQYLAKQPIYRLQPSDSKMLLLRRTLKSISVQDGLINLELGL